MQEITNYLPLNHKLFKHHFWCEEREYSRFEAWLDLLQSARFEDTEIYLGAKVIVVPRGCFLASLRYLAKRWQWSTKKVTYFFRQLSNFKMAATHTHKEAGCTLVTILNYDRYNYKKQNEETVKETCRKQSNNSQVTNNNKANKEKIDNFFQLKKQNKNKEKDFALFSELEKSFTLANFKKILLAEGANLQHITDWCQVRKSKNAYCTRTALERFLLECRKHNYPVAKAVQLCAENSWSGFKVEWVKNLEAKMHTNGFKESVQEQGLVRSRV